MNRKVPFVIGEYYHLYNRGVDKRKIFLDRADYDRFTMLLYLCNGTNLVNIKRLKEEKLSYEDIFKLDRGDPLVGIGAYCLMPNHFHILVKEIREGGISLFMQKLSTAYVMYINSKYNRSGTLFQGRFRSEHIDDDNYLKYLYVYIHLNPLKLLDPHWKEKGQTFFNTKEAKEYLEHYRYSSYLVFLGKSIREGAIINQAEFPAYFSDVNDFSG